MSLRNHQIESSFTFFIEGEDDYIIGMISKTSETSMPVIKTESESHEDSMLWKVGYGSVKVGTILLSIPDPIPFIDETIGIGLVAGGAALMYSQQR